VPFIIINLQQITLQNRPTMKLTTLLTAFVAFFLLVSCAATTESETEQWEASQKTISMLSTKYPEFKPVLKKVLNAAQLDWQAAIERTGEEQQIEGMLVANETARPTFVVELEQMSEKIESLKDLAIDATQTVGVDVADDQALEMAGREADLSLSKAENTLESATVTTVEMANVIVGGITEELDAARNRIEKVMQIIEDKKDEAEAEINEIATEAAEKEAAKEESTKAIKCSYCGSMNASDALECSGCGAPVEK
jgi:chromosome segregation ATPase